jgi:hypothetical protein
MDAIQFLKTVGRICKTNNGKCDECPLDKYPCSAYINCIRGVEPDKDIEEMVKIADRWAKDHPVKTRQSEVLKMFPNAYLETITRLLPCSLDGTLKPFRCAKYGYLSITCRCDRCRDDYWNEEVTDND